MSRDVEGHRTAPHDGGEGPLRRRSARRRLPMPVVRVALAALLGGLGGAALYVLLEGL